MINKWDKRFLELAKVVCTKPDKAFEGRWLESCNEAKALAEEAGINYEEMNL